MTNSTEFEEVTECLPQLMDGLHMVWVLSRFYCTDEQMVPLLERVAWCLCEKVITALNNEILFRYYMSCKFLILKIRLYNLQETNCPSTERHARRENNVGYVASVLYEYETKN